MTTVSRVQPQGPQWGGGETIRSTGNTAGSVSVDRFPALEISCTASQQEGGSEANCRPVACSDTHTHTHAKKFSESEEVGLALSLNEPSTGKGFGVVYHDCGRVQLFEVMCIGTSEPRLTSRSELRNSIFQRTPQGFLGGEKLRASLPSISRKFRLGITLV